MWLESPADFNDQFADPPTLASYQEYSPGFALGAEGPGLSRTLGEQRERPLLMSHCWEELWSSST